MKKYLLLIALLILCIVPVMGQDATAEATVEAMPVVIVADETPANVDNSPIGLLLTVGVLFVGAITAISLGLQVAGNRAQTAANNPLEIAVIEKAYESIPPAVLTAVVEPLKAALERSDKALQSVLDLLNKAGDKVPEANKPATYPPVTGTPLEANFTSTSTTDVGGSKAANTGVFPPPAHGS